MSIKPVIRELRQAVLHGMGHAQLRLHHLADNMVDHLDTVAREVADLDQVDDAVARGWWKDRKLRKGEKTEGGWHFLPEDDRPFAGDVPRYPGEYVLDLHGSPSAVQGADGSMLTAEDFAAHVRKHTDWDGTTPIRLFSCSTGADSDGFAQQLSNHLNVEVTAPTKPVWSSSHGTPFVTDVDPVTGKPVKPHNGSWTSFQPNGE
ncbi:MULTISPECIES: hypothetical protein [unclassified Microbacterium]|uniref:hypothetical protein n=1 Tax=unclassified Microbacterium TaxID=2609290 RepID=UPI001AC9B70E|nr:hypothetical protein [Microbacterium sp.]MBN9157554.1 hypothetical protein [Microbacterium sp.]MBS1898392.1 hypothetical protein [Actinomycetota bacterium]